MMRSDRSNLIFQTGYLIILGVSLFIFILVESRPNTQAPPPTSPPASALAQPDSPLVAQIPFSTTVDRQYLTGQYDVWQVDHNQQTVTVMLSAAQQRALQQAGYRINIDQPKTDQLRAYLKPIAQQDTGIPGFACYRTVEETYASLHQLAADFPILVSWLDIGDSWQKVQETGGYDIQVVVLTNKMIPGSKPKLFLLSAVHARELATAELATRFAEYLVLNYGQDPDITWLLDYAEVHILPIANPDGRKQAEKRLLWRKNVDNDDGCNVSDSWGVDLNRNSSFKWHSCLNCSSGDACSLVYRGPAPSSEPETQAFESYVSALYPDQRGPLDQDVVSTQASGIFITLHSYGKWILFPWGWNPEPAPNNSQLETLGRKFGFYTNYETCQAGEPGCIYATDGTNDDWAYGQLGLAAYTFELGTSFFQGCSYFEETLVPDNLPALIYAIKAAQRPYQTPAGPESLDVAVTPNEVKPGTIITLTTTADDTRYDSNGWGNEPTQSIAAMRYSINHPSWLTGTTTYPLTAADGQFDTSTENGQAIIDTTGWVPGRYQILVESLDNAGNWGVPSSVFLSISVHSTISTGAGQPGIHQLNLTSIITDVSYAETYTITTSLHQWHTRIPETIGPLIIGTTQIPLEITITPPVTATIGASETISLTLIAQSTGVHLPVLRLTTKVQGQLFLPVISKAVND